MYIVGIDIGSVSVATVAVDEKAEIVAQDYRFHKGEIENSLAHSFDALGIEKANAVIRTRNSSDTIEGALEVDDRVSFMKAASRRFDSLGSLLIVGAETFSIIHFGEDGSYKRLRTNSSCAAGTGSFLDQQARRLSLSGSGELSQLALSNSGEVPKIASRCAVFAKTDLIHAQAEGYGLAEICDGLCLGLAKNITDTLVSDEAPPKPVVFAGGVSKNDAVVRHLEELLYADISTDELGPVYGAYGATLAYIDGEVEKNSVPETIELHSAIRSGKKGRGYYYDPLSLRYSTYPNFEGLESFVYSALDGKTKVETDIYTELSEESEPRVYLGIDIGSTSTKAVLSAGDDVYAGFYTRTAGKPMYAVQAIFETIRAMEERFGLRFRIEAAATTGSGRKFIGRVIGADLIIDEITAHAQAAYRLDSRIDTIIEIGGQDSKFTTMREGMVTFSQMNTICAAGTGSFLEEQAQKLGVPLSEYSDRAEQKPAPLTSDRCTVFMERDINNYLNQDYAVDEVLAAALFSVRENYLQKVATEAHIGEHVCFQGATAKNRALVAAFEQKLDRPIFVSKYCHLTGALGAALIAEDERNEEGKNAAVSTSASSSVFTKKEEEQDPSSTFRGLDLYKEEIPIRTEICELCTNHCRIRIAEVEDETVAFGFLCGRDYETKRYVDRNISGFDMLRERRKLFSDAQKTGRMNYEEQKKNEGEGESRAEKHVVFGLPAGLHMVEDLALWKRFFAELGFSVITSERLDSPIKRGKELSGAEFCAPMTAFHGHCDYVAEHADVVFLPIYLDAKKEDHEENKLRKYCYYTQYAPSLTTAVQERRRNSSPLTPLIHPGRFQHNIRELHRVLGPYLDKKTAIIDIGRAYSAAHQYKEGKKEQLTELFSKEFDSPQAQDIHVVLVGRPYTILSQKMNNRIPEIFGTLGIKTYFQDMLPQDPQTREEIEPILSAFHWHYAADILEAAAYAAHTPGLYPVYITSFKCSPDSFAVDYFKRILDAKEKPYLILQLDEHDSSVGYETRIEAGVRAFRNHARKEREINRKEEERENGAEEKQNFLGVSLPRPSIPNISNLSLSSFKAKKETNPALESDLEGKTLLFPNWDPLTNPLIVANLRREGIDARILHENDTSIRKSMRLNTGQCLPVSIIAQESMDYVRAHELDPAKTVVWIGKAKIACNIPMYPYYIKNVFEEEGHGMEKLGVYLGDISQMDIGPKTAVYSYFAYMFGGLLRKLGCRIRPYEDKPGETDEAIETSYRELEESFLGSRSFEETLERLITRFESIPRSGEEKPKVAIFGDLYLRDNDTMNQDLIKTIEEAGGEVVTTPYNEYAKIISHAYFRKWIKNGMYMTYIKNRSLLTAVELVEKKYYSYFKEFFSPSEPTKRKDLEEKLSTFNITTHHDGESMENILKIFHILEDHDDVALFVQASPSFCCPALVTEAMNRDIERVTGVPVLSITYDGTGTPQNDRIIPYLAYRSGKEKHSEEEGSASMETNRCTTY